MPASSAKPLPSYVPPAIIEDYNEACAIADLSPKASATLARRCLQGMIRDFCRLDNHHLGKAIKQLRRMEADNTLPRDVDPASLDAIDVVREVGNIGAHMEADINVIIDVEPEEAKQLIQLIELLVEDWYVTRHQREARWAAIKQLGASKEAARAGAIPDGTDG